MGELALDLLSAGVELLCFGVAYLLVPAITNGKYSLDQDAARLDNPPKVLSHATGVLIGLGFWVLVIFALVGLHWLLAG